MRGHRQLCATGSGNPTEDSILSTYTVVGEQRIYVVLGKIEAMRAGSSPTTTPPHTQCSTVEGRRAVQVQL